MTTPFTVLTTEQTDEMDITESDTPYHDAERVVQERAGGHAMAEQVAGMIIEKLSPYNP